MKKFLGIFIVCSLTLAGPTPQQLVVHLLNYIGSDYSGAVSTERKVISSFEYQEQVEFIQKALEQSKKVPQLAGSQFQEKLLQLQTGIEQKKTPTEIQREAQELSQLAIRATGINTQPVHSIDLVSGKELFQQNCSQCHGVTGLGDGPASGNFNPPPTQFTDPKLGKTSLFQLFNTIQMGIPGTAMAGFDHLAEEEIWNIAFYVNQLKKGDTSTQVSQDQIFLMKARWTVEESIQAYQNHQTETAKNLAITAYLEGVEPLEPKLKMKDEDFRLRLEKSLTELRHVIEQGSAESVVVSKGLEAQALLEEAEQLLIAQPPTFWFVFSVAFGIFLREAFEAALLLITLLGVVRTFGNRAAILSVHVGWCSALLIGVGAWFFSGQLLRISGAQRELIEGGVALFAVLILLYFGLWMHRTSEIGRWRNFIKQMVGLAKERKNILILGGVAFLGVFREVFETVLFLRALLLETSSQAQQLALGLGVFSAFILVVGLSGWSVKWSARIPVRNLFLISSWIMFFLSFILIGKGVHALQETGIVPITEMGLTFQSDLLGLYPFYQTLVAQVGFMALIGLFVWLEKRRTTG